MGILDTAVKKPITISMALLAVMILGGISLSRLSLDYFPDIEFPGLIVSTSYDGVGPEQVEESITKIIEGAVGTTSGIDELSSTSTEGSSSVSIMFDWGTDISDAANDVRESLDWVKDALPDDASTPTIFKFSMDMRPIMSISVSGSDDLSYLYDVIDTEISERLEQVNGVANVSIRGGEQEEIHVDFSKNRLSAYELDMDTIALQMAMENRNISGGETYEGNYKYSIRTIGEFEDIEDIKNMVVTVVGNVPIKISDLADVYYGYNEDTTIVTVNQQPGLTLSITKESGKNTVQIARGVHEAIEEINEDYESKGVVLTVLRDDSEDISSSLSGVGMSMIAGAIFAVLVVMLFLWDMRSMLIIGLSIPSSVIATFVMMYFFDVTLNIISIAGLSLGVGMMVDASIVVLENIFYHRNHGMGRYTSSIKGSKEVVLSITASTLTTLAVFVPIAFAGGFTSEVFTDMALTVAFSLAASLLVAVTVIPMLTSQIKTLDKAPWLSKMESRADRVIAAIDRFYGKVLDFTLQRKIPVLVTGIVAALAIIILIGSSLGTEFFPQTDEGQIDISIELPVGTRMEYTEEIVYAFEEDVLEICGEDLETIVTRVKSGGWFLSSAGENEASIDINLVSALQRKRSVEDIQQEIRDITENYAAEFRVSSGGMGMMLGGGGALAIQIFGEDLDVSEELANDIVDLLGTLDGIEEVYIDRSDPQPEIQLTINRTLAASVGLTSSTISSAIETAFGGTTASYLREDDGSEVDIVFRLAEEDRMSIDDLLSLSIPNPLGELVPISSIVEWDTEMGPSEISRLDSKRVIDVSASFADVDTGTITAIAEQAIEENIYIPRGYDVVFGGDAEDMAETFGSLAIVFVLAIVLVFAIMASQFESLVAPFVIMLSVPFGAAGSVIALWITGQSLSVVSIAGIVVLVGIVINNGIVLIDHINQLIVENRNISSEEAAKQGGLRRFRPVTMTTMTTVLGWLPMALGLGQGAELYAPLAISMLGGLLVSYFFTLVVVPTTYAGIRNHWPMKFHEDEDMALLKKMEEKGQI